jgi:hypothetical protein
MANKALRAKNQKQGGPVIPRSKTDITGTNVRFSTMVISVALSDDALLTESHEETP